MDAYAGQKRYYHLRAAEYDRSAWDAGEPEVARLIDLVAGFTPARTLDVGCGTGLLSQHLRGDLTLLDASEDMLAIAATRAPAAALVQAEVPPLPFGDAAFERVFSSHLYDHLLPADRRSFLAEARRVAPELVLVQQRGDTHWEGAEQRTLEDGSSHEIHKTYFTAASLLGEVGGELLSEGPVFLVVRSSSAP